MTDTVGIAGDRIRSIIERIEHIEEEINALRSDDAHCERVLGYPDFSRRLRQKFEQREAPYAITQINDCRFSY
jgi:hypothetical protein